VSFIDSSVASYHASSNIHFSPYYTLGSKEFKHHEYENATTMFIGGSMPRDEAKNLGGIGVHRLYFFMNSQSH